jgi:hypothetical protein
MLAKGNGLMMRLKIATFVGCFCLLSPSALAEVEIFRVQDEGRLTGFIRDKEGRFLGGVTVTVTGEKLMEARVATSDADGSYLVVGLPTPGEYTAVFELPGFAAFRREGILVKTTSYVNATLFTSEAEMNAALALGPKHFLALDLFGGWSLAGLKLGELTEQGQETTTQLKGFEVGATVRIQRWLGITGSYARDSNDERRLQHYLVGARFSTGYDDGVRLFTHVLVGQLRARFANEQSESGLEMVLGVGFDFMFFLRFQVDYVRLDLNGYKNGIRGSIGGVVPLCFSECAENDANGIDLSGR